MARVFFQSQVLIYAKTKQNKQTNKQPSQKTPHTRRKKQNNNNKTEQNKTKQKTNKQTKTSCFILFGLRIG